MQDDITRKGVVFNEMKGVYSSPDSVNQRTVQHSLFPDNTYGEDSGGDPKVIPQLTFEEFQVDQLTDSHNMAMPGPWSDCANQLPVITWALKH